MNLDHTDYEILRLLAENSRIQWKDLGKHVHMTGQAVGNRIKKLEEYGVIRAYTVLIDELKLGYVHTAFVVIYMDSSNHQEFINYVKDKNEILEVNRVSGEGCYHLKLKVKSHERLNDLLNGLLDYGNYKLHLSIQEVKKRMILE